MVKIRSRLPATLQEKYGYLQPQIKVVETQMLGGPEQINLGVSSLYEKALAVRSELKKQLEDAEILVIQIGSMLVVFADAFPDLRKKLQEEKSGVGVNEVYIDSISELEDIVKTIQHYYNELMVFLEPFELWCVDLIYAAERLHNKNYAQSVCLMKDMEKSIVMLDETESGAGNFLWQRTMGRRIGDFYFGSGLTKQEFQDEFRLFSESKKKGYLN